MNKGKETYFGHPLGLRDRLFTPDPSLRGDDLVSQTERQVRSLLQVSASGEILFGPNIATLTALILHIIRPKNTVFGPHELQWYKGIFGTGNLTEVQKVFTYPNRFFSEGIPKKPEISRVSSGLIVGGFSDVNVGDALYLSRISRLTGEPLMTAELYKKVKNSTKSTVIVDGAQTVGALMEKVPELCDIFLGVSSKFIGANPHLAFAWMGENILDKFPELSHISHINKDLFYIDYAGLLHHAKEINSLQNQNLLLPHLTQKRQEIFEILSAAGKKLVEPVGQPSHFLTFYQGNRKETQNFENEMKNRGILLTSTLGNWSFEDIKDPLIRLGINHETSDEDIQALKSALSSLS